MSEMDAFLSDFMDEKMNEIFRRNRVVDPVKETPIDQEMDSGQSEKTKGEEVFRPDRGSEEVL